MRASFIVVDDFYPNPFEMREQALACEFFESAEYVGLDGDQKVLHKELDDAVSFVVGEKIQGNMDKMGNHGRFRVTLGGQKNNEYMAGIHVDSNDCVWAGVVCLTLPHDIPKSKATGTHFYRHRQFNINRLPLSHEEEKQFGIAYQQMRAQVDLDGNDYSKWELEFQIPLEFNRLVLFRPWFFHDNGENFGDRIENGRLVHLLFFVPAPRTGTLV